MPKAGAPRKRSGRLPRGFSPDHRSRDALFHETSRTFSIKTAWFLVPDHNPSMPAGTRAEESQQQQQEPLSSWDEVSPCRKSARERMQHGQSCEHLGGPGVLALCSPAGMSPQTCCPHTHSPRAAPASWHPGDGAEVGRETATGGGVKARCSAAPCAGRPCFSEVLKTQSIPAKHNQEETPAAFGACYRSWRRSSSSQLVWEGKSYVEPHAGEVHALNLYLESPPCCQLT